MQGWIKLYRQLTKWEWYKDSRMVHLFIHLVLSANHEMKRWQGIKVDRGQLITGRKSLKNETGISEQTIRTCLNKLKSTGEITIQPTNRFSLITICQYETYNDNERQTNQPVNQPPNQQLTNNQPTANQQLTTNKNVKNDKNVKKYLGNSIEFQMSFLLYSLILERKKDFKEPNMQVWGKHIGLMIRIDKRTPENIERLINWCQADCGNGDKWKGWQNNILSTAKLREKYDKLDFASKQPHEETTQEKIDRVLG